MKMMYKPINFSDPSQAPSTKTIQVSNDETSTHNGGEFENTMLQEQQG